MNIGQGQRRVRLLVGLLLFGNLPKLIKEAGQAVKEVQKQREASKPEESSAHKSSDKSSS